MDVICVLSFLTTLAHSSKFAAVRFDQKKKRGKKLEALEGNRPARELRILSDRSRFPDVPHARDSVLLFPTHPGSWLLALSSWEVLPNVDPKSQELRAKSLFMTYRTEERINEWDGWGTGDLTLTVT